VAKGTRVAANIDEASMVDESTKWTVLASFEHGVVPTLGLLTVQKKDCATGWELVAREE
jgi:hypothetical protein